MLYLLIKNYILRFFYQKSDCIIIGKILGDHTLGFYSVAVDLARMPVDKFVMIISHVCFPIFSTLQDDLKLLKKWLMQ